MFALYFAICLVATAFIEYAGHRWLLHSKGTSVGEDHLAHHKTFTLRMQGDEVFVWYDWTIARILITLLWTSFVMTPIAFVLPQFAICFVVMVTLHAGVWNWVHNEMHRPTGVWWTNNSYFDYICVFHFQHHKYPRTNYGFLFAPVMDILFNTYRRIHQCST